MGVGVAVILIVNLQTSPLDITDNQAVSPLVKGTVTGHPEVLPGLGIICQPVHPPHIRIGFQRKSGPLGNFMGIPSGVAVDGDGDVYVADWMHERVVAWAIIQI